MSYIRAFETDTLPKLPRPVELTESARRIRALEEELSVYKRCVSPKQGTCKYGNNDWGANYSRRSIAEDHIKSLRDDLRKKDVLIQRLVRFEDAPRVSVPDNHHLDSLYCSEKSMLEQTHSDLAVLQVKNERLVQQVRDYETTLESKEMKTRELQNILDSSRGNEAHLTELVQTLTRRQKDLEHELSSMSTASNRGEFAISSLQEDLRSATDKIFELEGILPKSIEEKGSMAVKMAQIENNFMEVIRQLGGILDIPDNALDPNSSASSDIICKNVSDMVHENTLLKGRLVTLGETLANMQVEGKASRETIMRLVSEMDREQKATTRYTVEMENVRMERDNAHSARMDMKREIALLKERLDANDRALDATKAELEHRERRMSTLDKEVFASSQHTHVTAKSFQLFREQLANLLGTFFDSIDSSENCLMEAVRRLSVDAHDFKLRRDELEQRVGSLTDQLNKQLEHHRELEQRARRLQTDASHLESQLHTADGNLAANDVLREGFLSDKDKYLRGLQKLSGIMKMDRIALDLGMDMTMDALITRAEQLVKFEADALVDRSTQIYNLQRKVKSLKEMLESKELHIELIRKKLASHEERIHGKLNLEKTIESESLHVRKLERLTTKYKTQLIDARREIQDLKEQLLGTAELKVRAIGQRSDVETLARHVEELDEVRQHQARKISALKEEVAVTESQTKEEYLVADNAVQALSSELRMTKDALEAIKHREKQLLDFRNVVSRMLNLDVSTLAIPDYEIISRLEKLMKSHHTSFSALGLHSACSENDDPSSLLASDLEGADLIIGRARERSRRKAEKLRLRARSMSPRKRDTRIY